jgi:ankyrin repeat protein
VAVAAREGETPLMAAARTGNEAAVKLMIEHGAYVNAV